MPIAKIYAPGDGADGMWLRDDYVVEIAPGVDMALVVAIVLASEKMQQTYDVAH